MKARCLNAKNQGYKNYGARGIKVCDRWLESFENFRDDMLPTWKEELALDRINVNGNYEPSNCRWATRSENNKNKRNKAKIQSTFPGVTYDYNKWRYTIVGFASTEVEAHLLWTKLKDYQKSLR